jgi:hypothetical protein
MRLFLSETRHAHLLLIPVPVTGCLKILIVPERILPTFHIAVDF